jgi:chemotaxis family two-component system sensor kinase Cph1
VGSIELEDRGINLTSLKQPEINVLSKIQAYGVLLVLQEPELTVLQASNNTLSVFDLRIEEVLGLPLEVLLDDFQVAELRSRLNDNNLDRLNPSKIWVRRDGDDYLIFDAVFHRNADGFLVMELEPSFTPETIPFLGFYHLAKASINKLSANASLQDFGEIIVREVQKVTEFDRVMLYKFDVDGHGEVIAEVKLPDMESYLGLHFPESDIPQPARKLFLSNWVRVIPDARGESVDLLPVRNPITRQPTDLTLSVLRTPYPCHLEYLENMGVRASLTISLIKDGELWGIIACHHRTPKFVTYEVRKACEFLGQVIFAEIANREEVADRDYGMKLAHIQSVLIDRMAQAENFAEGLVAPTPNLLELVDAKGAAICYGGKWTTIGRVPSAEELNYLVQWLAKTATDDIFVTDALSLVYADARRFKETASGLIALRLSRRSYVLWFRPEVLQTVNWGGDPDRAYEVEESEGNIRLCPRKSFALWKETVSWHSLPWKPVEVTAAAELRQAIVNIVLRQTEELTLLAQDLERSNAELKKFAYVASHDLQEPLNQVANYVQLLEMRYDAELDGDAKEFIGFAVEGVNLMQTLIDDVLVYSKVDLLGIQWQLTEVQAALDRALNNLRGRISETGAIVTCDPMPTIVADSTQLMQLFQNLIGNAIKFRQADTPPQIHIGMRREEDEWLFWVQDNGIGIDPQFFDRIFVIFQRLHTRDEYPGSGMGLTICKKIVECHRGRIWVESVPQEGATFYFTIPVSGGDRGGGRKAYNHSTSRR